MVVQVVQLLMLKGKGKPTNLVEYIICKSTRSDDF